MNEIIYVCKILNLLQITTPVVHKICSKLKFCEKEPRCRCKNSPDADKIEKTLSTILSFDRVLQQQYRA